MRKKVDRQNKKNNSSDFLWFDPVNNDPHFIQLMASILKTEGIFFDLLTTVRSNFEQIDSVRFFHFLPPYLACGWQMGVIL
ncbi:hypothetical protein H206_02383 [Candidatus Electrothrix aarhusensis]|uniref:Uncharacterized protein n=1 Tax=Candidatus Electrothrix aarhusensis TaxID=1859131 RepID=A0A3S3R5X7_9BACT|nr:hypothetical protein H206_02383 [Candidatus Electrothrix aarhusensis]